MDKLTRAERSENMRRIRGKNTAPELAVRRIVLRLKYRFRTHAKHLPGKPDLIFPRQRKAIFVHGCFWHSHPSSSCKDSRIPKSRVSYWSQKLKRNTERDHQNLSALRKLGWKAIVIWGCQTEKDLRILAGRIKRFLKKKLGSQNLRHYSKPFVE
jgi:DNA mismatch endonuclease (patch repair protein)